jgi:preprotein translocase subunit YajC
MLSEVSVGDEIVTAGGIYGEITAVDEDDVRVRIAPDLEVRVARRAIAGVTTPQADDADELEEPEEPERPEPTPGT